MFWLTHPACLTDKKLYEYFENNLIQIIGYWKLFHLARRLFCNKRRIIPLN